MSTIQESLDKLYYIVTPVVKSLDATEQQMYDILVRMIKYQLEGKTRHAEECNKLLKVFEEREAYRRQAEEATAELEKTRVRLEDAERLLRECSNEYNELQEGFYRLKEAIENSQLHHSTKLGT